MREGLILLLREVAFCLVLFLRRGLRQGIRIGMFAGLQVRDREFTAYHFNLFLFLIEDANAILQYQPQLLSGRCEYLFMI